MTCSNEIEEYTPRLPENDVLYVMTIQKLFFFLNLYNQIPIFTEDQNITNDPVFPPKNSWLPFNPVITCSGFQYGPPKSAIHGHTMMLLSF